MPGLGMTARQWLQKALLVSAFFVPAVAWAAPAVALCTATAATEPVAVSRVIDGDTLELHDGRRVRLIGVDTPEIGYRGKRSEPYAQAARRRLQEMVAPGGLRLQRGQEPEDRYGRTLGHLFTAEGQNVEAQLLREGLGFALAVPPNIALWACHRDAEDMARGKRRALWAGNPQTPAGSLRNPGFALISGRVITVERTTGQYWIELDGPLVLNLRDQDSIYFADQTPSQWLGRELEVRGWVIQRRTRRAGHKPFLLPVRHPGMLRLSQP